jgi:hypothetical protein
MGVGVAGDAGEGLKDTRLHHEVYSLLVEAKGLHKFHKEAYEVRLDWDP